MNITLDEYDNTLRILMNIDRAEVPWMDDDQWNHFAKFPHVAFFRMGTGPEKEHIWDIIQSRSRRRPMLNRKDGEFTKAEDLMWKP